MGRKNSTVGDSKDREIVGIVPRPVMEYILTNQGMQVGYQPSSRVQIWNEYDSFAARISAPIWLLVWVLSLGKMGRGLWKIENLTRERLIVDMPPTKPSAPNQIPHVVNRKVLCRTAR